jgi:uncharacterized membrane protein SirB2
MELVKIIHVLCAVLTGISFFVRGVWMMHDDPRFQARLTRIFPHVVDTILLLTGVWMALYWQWQPVDHPWLLAKLLFLLLYIGFGLMAFRFATAREWRFVFWGLALLVLLHIYGFALSKNLLYFT